MANLQLPAMYILVVGTLTSVLSACSSNHEPTLKVGAPLTVSRVGMIQPTKAYLVFFDWDSAALKPHDKRFSGQIQSKVIAEAAHDAKALGATKIEISGYTDTTGTTGYNMRLSLRRAKTVATAIVSDGAPASEIDIHGYGESHLLSPTAPGVKEPRNRRVEIDLYKDQFQL